MDEDFDSLTREELIALLIEKQNNVVKAAGIGNHLLEENSRLKDKLEEQMKHVDKVVEAAEQEKYCMQMKLKQLTSQEEWYGSEISDLRQQLADSRETLKESLEAEKQQEVARLTRQIDDLREEVEKSRSTEAGLREKVKDLEELLQEKANRTVLSPCKVSFTEELGQLQEEISELQCENTTLKGQIISHKEQTQAASQDIEMLKAKLIRRDEELDDVKRQFSCVNSSLEKSRMEKLELRAQLDALMMETSHHSNKGNSLFGELEDRRVDAEKKTITLQLKVSSLQEKYEVEKQQNLKYKRQITQLLLQMSSGKVDRDHVGQLEAKLSQARQEIRGMLEDKQQLERQQKMKADPVAFAENGSSDKDYTQYLTALVSVKEEELKKTKESLQQKTLQLLDEQSRASRQTSQLIQLESEKEKLRSQNMKLVIKMEALRLEYNPESLKKAGSMVVRRVEQIPLEDQEPKITETSLAQNSTMNQSETSLYHVTQHLPSVHKDQENVPPRVKPEPAILKKKTVSMSDEVEEYDEEKHCEITTLKSESVEPKSRPNSSKPKGRQITTVKHASSSSKNECKNQ